MTRNETYNTKQKERILNIIKERHQEFTIKDIYEVLKEEVGLTTIYRLVDKLVSENKISKYIKNDNVTYYQYLDECDKENHFYLKCEKCGSITHIDCDCIEDLANHIKKHHEFRLNKEKIIINGICKNCIKKGE